MLDKEKLRAALQSKGFTVTDGALPNTLAFMFEGGDYYIDFDSNDENYIRYGFPSVYILTAADYGRALSIANKITESMKAVKVTIVNDKVFCSVEQFIRGEDDVLFFLMRALRALQGGANAFYERIDKSETAYG